AERLRHQARLQAHRLVAHLALELGARRERGDRVDRDDVDGARADQDVGDLECLLAVVGLRHEQLLDVDADPARVDGVDRMLCVDEGAHAPQLLGLGDDLVDERRLPRRLRAEDLDDPPARDAAHAEREVERERPVGIAATDTANSSSPNRINEPWPNWRSIWVKAAFSAAPLAGSRSGADLPFAPSGAFPFCLASLFAFEASISSLPSRLGHGHATAPSHADWTDKS